MCHICNIYVSLDFIYVPYVLSSFRILSAFIYVLYHICVNYVSYMNALNALSILDLHDACTYPSSVPVVVKGLSC